MACRKDVKQIITLRKGVWSRAADRLTDRERARRYGWVTGKAIPFHHPRLGDSEWEEVDTHAHTHLRGRLLVGDSFEVTDSVSL